MSVQPMSGMFDFIGDTWNSVFGSPDTGTGTTYTTTPTLYTDPFGFDLNFGQFTNPDTNPYLPAYNDYGYFGTTGQTADAGVGAGSGGGFDFNFTSFLDGISSSVSALGSVFGTGLQSYAEVQKLITSLSPQDQIVVQNGSPFIARTVNGQTTLIPASTVYPQLTQQFNTAKKSNQTQMLLLAGALGLGLVLILKKKK